MLQARFPNGDHQSAGTAKPSVPVDIELLSLQSEQVVLVSPTVEGVEEPVQTMDSDLLET